MILMAQTYKEYLEEFATKYADFPMYEPFPEHIWSQGYNTFMVRMPKSVHGLTGDEASYTLQSWWELNVPNRKEMLGALNMWRDGAIRTIYLWSTKPGTGKTGFAVACARDFADSCKGNALIVRIPDFSMLPYAEQSEVIARASEYQAVILDDAHRFRFTIPGQADMWHSLCDRLNRQGTKVIVTANASFNALAHSCGQDLAASWDRIRAGGMEVIEVQGGSLR